MRKMSAAVLFLLFSGLSAGGGPAGLFGAQPSAGAAFARGPYLENMSSEMVTVRFRLDAPASAWITYGAWPDCERFMTNAPLAVEQKITLFGLLADTTHCYRIYLPANSAIAPDSAPPSPEEAVFSDDDPAAAPKTTGADGEGAVYKAFEGQFLTFRGEDKPYFTFMVFGDSGSGSEEQLEVAAQMEKFNPDFIVHTGDIVESGLDADAGLQYFTPYAKMLARIPVFPALGNHDYGRDFKKQDGKGFIKANYQPFHTVPLTGLPPHYYFFDVGNARFFVLDTNKFYGAMFAPGLEPESKQYKWLDHFLSKTKAAWKFVVVHQPLYSTGAHTLIAEERAALEPLFLKHRVDLVLQGHDHDYERTKPVKEGVADDAEGIVYLTLAGGGRPLYFQRNNADWSEKFLPVYNFAFFEVKDGNLKMTAYNKEGQVIDTMEMQK